MRRDIISAHSTTHSVSRVGDAKVQTLCYKEDPCGSLSRTNGPGTRGFIRALAARPDRCVCLRKAPLQIATRLIEFGRNAIANRHARGLGKPETFDFLGFKHYCATRRDASGFVLGRKPMAKRMRTELREIKERLMATHS